MKLKTIVEQIMCERVLEPRIPTAMYFHVDHVSVPPAYRGKGIGERFYKLLFACMSDKAGGLLSTYSSKLSTAQHVSKIYKKLGGLIGIKGDNDTYDVVFKKDVPKFTSKTPIKKGNYIYADAGGIYYKLEELSDRRITIEAHDMVNGKPAGHISATSWGWDEATEEFNFD